MKNGFKINAKNSMLDNLKKWFVIQKTWNESNLKNDYAMKWWNRLLFKIERNLLLKFFIVLLFVFILITILNHFISNPVNQLITDYYIEYIGFPRSDDNTARYFFSAVPQSLSALIAISFTVMLIYLQISVDKYSIHTVKYVFDRWGAISVLTLFMVTIIYSFFELGKIRDIEGATFQFDSKIQIILILTIVCIFSLVYFFYKTISSLIPENFVRDSGKRIRKVFVATLDFTQLIRIKNTYFKNKIDNLENIELSYFLGNFGLSDSNHPISTTKRGLVCDIDFSKIKKCSKLLFSDSKDNKLKLNIPMEGKVSSASNILGYIECSDNGTIHEVEKLVKKAYKIDDKKTTMLEDYKELTPISSLTIKAIKDYDIGVAEGALDELSDIIIEYVKRRKNFGLMPSCEQVGEVRFGRDFLDESFIQLEKIMKVSIKDSESDIIDEILYRNIRIGRESIILQDLETFKKVIQFCLYFSYRLEEDSIDRNLLYSRDLQTDIIYYLDGEKNSIDYVKCAEYLLNELINYYGKLTRILMDKQTHFTLTCLGKLLSLNHDFDRFIYDNTKHQLDFEFRQLKPEDDTYKQIEKNLEVIEEKEKISLRLKSKFNFIIYNIGTYIMVNLERGKYNIDFSRPIFDKLVEVFKKNNLEDIFNEILRVDSLPFDNWFHEHVDDGEAYFVDTTHIDRFYILMTALLFQKGKKLKEIKVIDKFNETQLETFKIEFKKLNDKSGIWDQLLEGKTNEYFDKILERLEECAKDRDNNLREKIRTSDLSDERVEKVKSDIISHTTKYFEVANYINVKETIVEDNGFIYRGINTLVDKKYFVDETVDPTTYYDYNSLGGIYGRDIGIGESEYLINQIFEKLNIKQNQIQFETFSIKNLNEAKEQLKDRGFNATTILMSFDLSNKLWHLNEFTHSERKSDDIPIPYGTIEDIEIYHNRVIPKKVAIIFDKAHIGTLKVKEALNPRITMDFDKKEIIKKELKEGKIKPENKEERMNELDEKVNIIALEKIKFKFGNPEAGLVLFIDSDSP